MEQQRGLCSFTLGSSTRCGSEVSGQPTIRLSITSTTGSPVELTVPRGETVAGLRTHISKELRLQTDRIVLLHRHKWVFIYAESSTLFTVSQLNRFLLTSYWVCVRQLTAGRLLDLGVTDGSTLILLPVIEAGLVVSEPMLCWGPGESRLILCGEPFIFYFYSHSVRLPGLKEVWWTCWKV